jgi:ribA/ribD-fused uncharacterized protein
MIPTPDDKVYNLDGSQSTRYGGQQGLRYVQTYEEALKIFHDRGAMPPRMFVVPRELFYKVKSSTQPRDSLNGPKLFGIPVKLDSRNASSDVIDSFTGYCRFLSNFYECNITDYGLTFPSAEHLYQAYKAKTNEEAMMIRAASTPSLAKRLGRSISVRKDWEAVKLMVMQKVVWMKFTQNEHLKDLLLATGDMVLVEGNNWGDRFWGTINNDGENHLGRILMNVRQDLRRMQNA